MSTQTIMEPMAAEISKRKTDKRGDLVTTGPGHVFGKFVTNIRLKAHETRKVLIGSSTSPVPPKGFSVELKPQKMPGSMLSTEITAEGSTNRYDFVLDITNRSDRSVSAQVWQL